MILISIVIGIVASIITWFAYGAFEKMTSAEAEHDECVRAREAK